MNLRPLDPQDIGVGIPTGQTRCRCRAGEKSTCGSSALVQDVWSPNGPQQDTPPTLPPPSRPGRQSRRDGSLTMITGGTGFEGPVILRLTDACRFLLGPRDGDVWRSSGGVRVRHGAARCGQNCGHAVAAGALHMTRREPMQPVDVWVVCPVQGVWFGKWSATGPTHPRGERAYVVTADPRATRTPRCPPTQQQIPLNRSIAPDTHPLSIIV